MRYKEIRSFYRLPCIKLLKHCKIKPQGQTGDILFVNGIDSDVFILQA